MVLQAEHDFLVTGNHDEVNRQHYVSRLRMHILNEIGKGMRDVYENRVKEKIEKSLGKQHKNEHAIRKGMLKDNYGRMWSSMMVNCQDMVWDSVKSPLERSQPELNKRISNLKTKVGSLTLDKSMKIPKYLSCTDIHRMPGSYHTERVKDDSTQGALYDRGRFIYNAGQAGKYADAIPRSMAKYINKRWPGFKPKKILELGCTIGTSTIPFVETFPDAEVHAVDVSAPCLRYGHARAESLGKSIHFHQMNAEKLNFNDNEFDLVYSCIMFHETSRKALPEILKECQRVLNNSGMMMHAELMPSSNLDSFDAFYMNWDAYYNNEPFYQTYTNLNPTELVSKAGFKKEKIFQLSVPDVDKTDPNIFNKIATNYEELKKKTGRVGEGTNWYTFGAWK